MKKINPHNVARLHSEADGYHITRDSYTYLDTRGKAFRSVAAALAYIRECNASPCGETYTHYVIGLRRVRKV